jgi:hypothetical protein
MLLELTSSKKITRMKTPQNKFLDSFIRVILMEANLYEVGVEEDVIYISPLLQENFQFKIYFEFLFYPESNLD